jgi:hypothetical protein
MLVIARFTPLLLGLIYISDILLFSSMKAERTNCLPLEDLPKLSSTFCDYKLFFLIRGAFKIRSLLNSVPARLASLCFFNTTVLMEKYRLRLLNFFFLL